MPARLFQFVKSLKSIRPRNRERWKSKGIITSIVFVGSSCAGKSTIVDAIRDDLDLLGSGIRIPRRFVTRPPRQADNLIENCHLSTENFGNKVRSGEIGLNWVRKMEGGRAEQYGFESVQEGEMAVYSGNNALYDNPESIRPSGVLDHALFVGVFAPDEVRRQRLLQRSPDLLKQRPEEVRYRLGDRSNNMLPHVDLVILNYGLFEDIVSAETNALMKALVSIARRATLVKVH